MNLILLQPLLGWTKNSADWTNCAKARYSLAFGYPKAYVGTSSGEVCSKHKTIKKEEIR